MRSVAIAIVLGCGFAWAQASPAGTTQSGSQTPVPPQNSNSAQSVKTPPANAAPPRSDRVDVRDLGDDPGESSSKDNQVDLSPPAGDDKSHPQSQHAVSDAELSSEPGDVSETHLWDPHKAAKDVEIGDFYFKRQNYVAAESRYREALLYKENDAVATFRLAESLEKLNRLNEARQEYESYLQILPHGPQASAARKALGRLNSSATNGKSVR